MKQKGINIKYLLILLLFFAGFSSMAVAKVIALHSVTDRINLDAGIRYLVDDNGSLTLEQVSQNPEWKTWQRGSANFGFSESVYWLHWELTSAAEQDLPVILEIAFPFLQRVDLYVESEAGFRQHLQSGSRVPLQQRPLSHSLLLFPFDLPANSNSRFYLRIRSDSLLQVPLAISGKQSFIDYDHKRSLFFGAIYSLLAVIGIYHCLIFFSVRDSAYLFYGMFSLSLSLGFFLLNGSAGSYLWPWNPNLSLRAYVVSMQVSIFFAVLFIRSILDLEKALPTWNKLVGYVARSALLFMVVSLFVSIQIGSLLGLILANISIVLSTIVIFLRTLNGYPPARYLLFAVIFTAVGIFVTVSSSLTLIPTNLVTIHAVYVGLSVGTMLYAFALAYRINMERQEREQAQVDLIEVQRTTNENLDRIVRERTQELEVSNQRLREISEKDGLTQLYNRRYFDVAFDKELRRSKRAQRYLAILLLDLDFFKQINDRYGHQFGDECLIVAAELMQSCIRRPTDFAARYGGEEFVILLPETDQKGAVHVAETIREIVGEHQFNLDGETIQISVSIGVNAIIPDGETTPESVLKAADEQLYTAKQNGRNRVEPQVS